MAKLLFMSVVLVIAVALIAAGERIIYRTFNSINVSVVVVFFSRRILHPSRLPRHQIQEGRESSASERMPDTDLPQSTRWHRWFNVIIQTD